ncbi:MAG: hypothetical protein EXR00_03795 [Alphaproteobacteria bacterium]|nr:hypothetical protein [Alphaproteobacteria bacterium]
MTRTLPFLVVTLFVAATVPSSAELRNIFVPVRTVGLGPIAEPDDYVVVATGGAQQYDARTFLRKEGARSLADAMAGENLHLGGELHEAVAEALLEAGLEVVPSDAKDARIKLAVAIMPNTVAYSDQTLGDDLMPGFTVRLFVTDARTGRFLKTDSILYGQTTARGVRTVYPDARYRFSSVDALLADPKSAAEGFRAGITAIAKEIAKGMGGGTLTTASAPRGR